MSSPIKGTWPEIIERRLAEFAAQDRWRSPRTFDAMGPVGRIAAHGNQAGRTTHLSATPDREVVSFASNDYLGLSCHERVVAAAREALERWGSGAGASRLITGSRPVHAELEAELAGWKRAERAVCFPTGYAANLGALSALAVPGSRILSDELNHASIIDACRLSAADVAVYCHGDLDHLSWLLGASSPPTIIVTDAVFSMDGDRAPLVDIAELCRTHGAAMVVDEAHSVLGPDAGSVVGDGVVLLRVGTLSKTLGSLGGFVVGPRSVIELIENAARSYIFTTAATPADAAAALAALNIVRSDEGDRLRSVLTQHLRRLDHVASSPIVPIVVGEERAAKAASASLLERGIWVPAIRPPTVAPGSSRLRVTLSAAHTPDQVTMLIDALTSLGLDPSRRPAAPRRAGPGEGPSHPETRPNRASLGMKRGLDNRLPTVDAVSEQQAGQIPWKPDLTVVVAGTGTGVGKTWVSAALIGALRRSGYRVQARKPAQSFDPNDDPETFDAALLGHASGEAPEDVCRVNRQYPVAMAPPMAAEVLGRAPFTLTQLIAELSWSRPDRHESDTGERRNTSSAFRLRPMYHDRDTSGVVGVVGVVETAGGVRSPQAVDGDVVGFVRTLRPELVVLVADAELGAIHAVRSSAEGLVDRPGQPTPWSLMVILNHFDPTNDVHVHNRRWLANHDGFFVMALPGDEGKVVGHLSHLVKTKR